MSDYTDVLNRAISLDTSPAFSPYTGVRLWYDDEHAFFAGNETGRVLEADCPWATQSMANSVLASVSGFTYQPFTARGALLDPAAELGDDVSVGGVRGPLASVNTVFDAMCAAEISAPEDEEINHEYPYLTPQEREMARKVTLGADYYGTRISRRNGLEIIKTAADGTEKSRAILNSDVFALYNDDGAEALYFDTNAGKFKFSGDVAVTGGTMNINDNFIVDANGNLTINGNINLSGGTITWGSNNPGGGSGGISESRARTLINEELVSSPNIAGGKFWDLEQTTHLEMGVAGTSTAYLNHYADVYGSDPVCVMGYIGSQIYPTWVIAPFGRFGLEFQYRGGSYPYIYAYGDWDFSQASTTGLYLRFS